MGRLVRLEALVLAAGAGARLGGGKFMARFHIILFDKITSFFNRALA